MVIPAKAGIQYSLRRVWNNEIRRLLDARFRGHDS
jgi:hypothetical protein